MFNFYSVMTRIAATAAVGALLIAGTLRPAHGQGAAAPAKTYKPGEFEMYDGALKALGAQNFAKAVSDAEAWEVFNMGCGFVAIVPDESAEEAAAILAAHHPGAARIGSVTGDAGRVTVAGVS